MNMCIQTAIRSFKAKYKISKSYPKGHPFFLFFLFFFSGKYKILKTALKRPFAFLQQSIKF